MLHGTHYPGNLCFSSNNSPFPLAGAPWAPGWALAQVAQAVARPPVPWAWGPGPHRPWGGRESQDSLASGHRVARSKDPWFEEGGQSEGNKLLSWYDRSSSWKGKSLPFAWPQAPGSCPLHLLWKLREQHPCSMAPHLLPLHVTFEDPSP